MKQHKWHKEIKAWADGAEIERWYWQFEEWRAELNPNWDERYEYRIKPEPKPDVIKYLNMIVNNYGTRVYITDTIDDNPQWEIRIKLTLDCDTYEPKSVELIEKGNIK
jgi:hypothetical protein